MEVEKMKAIIEAILFSAGRVVKINELILVLEKNEEEIQNIIENMQEDYQKDNRGIEIIKIEDGYQLATKKELYDYIYPILDKRTKPNLSNAALETLAIIAYNPKITRAEIEAIRGVSADLPGKPMSYKTTNEFLRMFGYTSLNDLPELPRYKLDENQQIVIDDLSDEKYQEEVKNMNEDGNKENGKNDSREEIEEYKRGEPMPGEGGGK